MKSEIPENRNHQISNLSFDIGDVRYTWSGNFGAILISVENVVKNGDLRIIADVPMVASHVHKKWWYNRKSVVYWIVIGPEVAWIGRFKKHLLGI